MEPEPESNEHNAGESSTDPGPDHRPVDRPKAPRQQQPAAPRQFGSAPPHQHTYGRPIQVPAPPASAYYPMPVWLPTPPPSVPSHYGSYGSSYGYELPPQPQQHATMTAVLARPSTPLAPAAVGGVEKPREASKSDLESEKLVAKLAEELRKLRADSARHDEAQSRKIRQDVDRQVKSHMAVLLKTNEETKREIELARVANETAAKELQEQQRKAEMRERVTREERERIEAEIEKETEKQRALEQAAAIKEKERAVIARLQKEDRAQADRKLELEKFKNEIRAQLEREAQDQATIAEARRTQLTEELRAREEKVYYTEFRNELTTQIITAEKALIVAMAKANSSREFQLDVRERELYDAENRTLHTGGKAMTVGTDDSANIGNWWDHLDDNRDDGKGMVLRGQVQEFEMVRSHSHSTQDQKPTPLAPPSNKMSTPPSNKMSKDDASGERVPVDFDVVYNSANTRDMTVHLKLALSQDIDDELEEFSQLSRMGNFASAESFFNLRLKRHFSNPSVFVQYADMLLEKGDFKALMLVDDSSVFAKRDSDGAQKSSSKFDQLEMNWKLIQAIALCYSQHTFRCVRDVLKGLDTSWSAPGRHIESTQLRNLTLAIRLTKLLPSRPQHPDGFDRRPASDLAPWRKIYQQLLSEDRIWDFRDAFIAVCTSYGIMTALHAFFEYPSPIEGLVLDWQTDSHDESTELALLDLLSFMALVTSKSADDRQLTETCLHLAEPIGNSLLDNFPHAIRSRMFVQWVVAKSVVWPGTRTFNYLADYRGYAVFPEFETGMPYYVPIHQENPGWLPPDLTPAAYQSLHGLQMALSTAREIHDYRTEARCLQELCLRTQDPSRHLQELAELQKSKQHDMAGYLATCLTRYLTCVDVDTKRALLDDVESFGSWEDASDLVNPTLAAARDVIARALSLKSADDSKRSIEAAVNFYPYLFQAFQRTIDSIVPRGPPESNAGEGRSDTPPITADEEFVDEKRSDKDENAQSESGDEALRVEELGMLSDNSEESDVSDGIILDV